MLLGIGVFQLCKRACAWLRMWLFRIWNKGSSTKEAHQFKPAKLARILQRLSLGKAEVLEHVRPVWFCVCREVTHVFVHFGSLSKELSPGKCSCRELCNAGLHLLDTSPSHSKSFRQKIRSYTQLRKKWSVKNGVQSSMLWKFLVSMLSSLTATVGGTYLISLYPDSSVLEVMEQPAFLTCPFPVLYICQVPAVLSSAQLLLKALTAEISLPGRCCCDTRIGCVLGFLACMMPPTIPL